MNSSKISFIIMAIQGFIVCLSNLPDKIQIYLPKIILYLTKTNYSDSYLSQIILEFLMRKFSIIQINIFLQIQFFVRSFI